MTNLRVDSDRIVTVDLVNTGPRSGAQVVQLYLAFPPEAGEPPQQLKAFQKVHLNAGEKAQVTLELTPRDFSVWSVAAHAWQVVSGTFGVSVGGSSRDRRLVGEVHVSTNCRVA